MPFTIDKCELFRIKHNTILEGGTFLRNKHKIAFFFFWIKCTFFGRKENTISSYRTAPCVSRCFLVCHGNDLPLFFSVCSATIWVPPPLMRLGQNVLCLFTYFLNILYCLLYQLFLIVNVFVLFFFSIIEKYWKKSYQNNYNLPL